MAILCPFYVPPQKSNGWEEVGIGVWCLLMYKKGHAVVRCPGLLFVNGDRKGHKWHFMSLLCPSTKLEMLGRCEHYNVVLVNLQKGSCCHKMPRASLR